MNSKASERAALLAFLPPAAATDARTTGYSDFGAYGSGKVTVLVGDASATGTLTLLRAASGTGGSSVSVATAAYGGTGTAGDNKGHILNITQADIDDDPSRPYFAVTLGGGVANAACTVEGVDPRYAPVTHHADVTVHR
jgi:hypothetical protein